MIRVLLVDDHAWVRETLSLLLGGTDDLLVVGTCTDGAQVSDAVAALQPEVVLMDVQMPVVSGLEAARRLQDAGSAVRVIITGSLTPGRAAQEAAAVGAAGVVPKGSPPALLLETIRGVATGHRGGLIPCRG
jgi:DNA-binding NarL/FixJ family response regulator